MSSNNQSRNNESPSATSLFSDVNNDDFKKRQNDLFNVLLQTEKETIKKDSFLSVSNKKTMSEKIKLHRNIRHEYNQTRSEPKNNRRVECVFKKPDSRCSTVFRKPVANKTPDFIANPHKWTKYSLASVTENDLSERSNTNAALSFLNDLKKRRSIENDSVNMDCSETAEESDGKTSKILFKKKSPVRSSDMNNASDRGGDQDHYVGTKHVMPEYVVGQSNRTKKIKNTDVASIQVKKNNKEIALNHLYEEEDDC